MRRAAFLVVLSIAALPGSVGAGSYTPPPGDCCPQWSPDGTYVSFLTNRGGHALNDVKQDGTAEQTLIKGNHSGEALSLDWRKLAWIDAGQLFVKTIATDQIRKLVDGVDSFVWAPDSSRLAALSNGTLAIVGLTGDLGPPLAQDTSDPAWSPSGDRIAVVEQSHGDLDVHAVRPDGGDVDITAGDRRANIRPIWSRDGKLAFLTSDGTHVNVEVSGVAGHRRTLKTRVPITNGVFAWLPDGRTLALGLDSGIFAVDVSSGRMRKLPPLGSGVIWSPNGNLVAYAAGGECRDRVGIYVARANGSGARRITNDCRISGTAGNDTLRGTAFADVLTGLGGNDRLFASDPGYVGDTLLGGAGNDALVGGFRQDTLDGGSGDDVLDGGPSGDTLLGGPGRDHLNGQDGADVIRAVDGERDVITCGPNSYGPAGRDTVYADRADSVASDCEIIHAAADRDRSGAAKASLTITVWPDERRPGTSRTWTLRCDPAGGTLRGARTACSRLARLGADAFAPTPPGSACTQIYGGPQLAFVRGSLGTRRVWTKLRRRDGCEIARWNRVAFLLPTP